MLARLALILVLFVAACTTAGSEASTTSTGADAVGTTASDATAGPDACPTQGEELVTAKLYIEHNATDEDTGIHGLFGGEAWSELCVWDPQGRLILFVDPEGPLNELRVADLFFESREPGNDEVPVAEVLTLFPEGEYLIGGTDFEGIPRVGTALFTHDIPEEPTITAPELAEDEESTSGTAVPSTGLVIRWEPVTTSITGEPMTITGYEVIVTNVEREDPNGFSTPVYDVHVRPDATSLGVPEGFLEEETVYELEVLALEESGNQTISVGFFETE